MTSGFHEDFGDEPTAEEDSSGFWFTYEGRKILEQMYSRELPPILDLRGITLADLYDVADL